MHVKFNVGDLVKLSPLLIGSRGKVDLTTFPPEITSFSKPDLAIPIASKSSKNGVNAVFHSTDVGVVIAFERMDCRSVFVLCSTGCGWVSGAFLIRV
jgi:hypothetical protein